MSTITANTRELPALTVSVPRFAWRELAVLALAAAMILVYFTGVIASDDNNYFRLVSFVRQGEPIPDELDYFVGRFAHWRLIQLAVALLPRQPWAMAVPNVLLTLATFWLLRTFARPWLRPEQAWVPMLIYALIPMVVINASVAVPDPVAATLGWGGMFLAAGALIHQTAPAPLRRCLLAGLLIGLAGNAKETILLLVPGMMLFVLLCRTRCGWAWTRGLTLVAGAFAWLGAEMLIMWQWRGDPLFHLQAARSALKEAGWVVELTPTALLAYWTEYFRWLADPRSEFGPVGPLLLAGLIAALIWRRPLTNLLLCCLIPALLYLSFGSSELSHYFPVCHQQRYLVPWLPGMALLAGFAVVRLWTATLDRPRLRIALIGLGVAMAGLSLVAPNRLSGRWYHAATFAAGRQLLADHTAEIRQSTGLYASGLTRNRFVGISCWLDCPEVKVIEPVPADAAEWVARYGGSLIITSRLDRQAPGKEKHAPLTLFGSAVERLSSENNEAIPEPNAARLEPNGAPSTGQRAAGSGRPSERSGQPSEGSGQPSEGSLQFQRIARCEPAADRLRSLWAKLTGRPAPTDPRYAVELWRVPSGDSTDSRQGNDP